MIFGVTGHRPDKLGGYDTVVMAENRTCIKCWLREQLVGRASYLVTGMALGVDQWAAEVCIEAGIPFVAALPFEGQAGNWPDHSQWHYRRLLEQAAQIVCVSRGYAVWKFQKRNEYIVDHCAILLAVWNGSSGGTANCVKYAEKVRRPIKRFDPGKGARECCCYDDGVMCVACPRCPEHQLLTKEFARGRHTCGRNG